MNLFTISRALLLAGTIAVLPAAAVGQSMFTSEMSAGREAFDGSNFGLAERHFQGALEIAVSDGQKSTALYSLGVIAQKLGRVDEAKERVGKSLELSPKNSQAQRLLEELNQTAGKPAAKPVKQVAAAAAEDAPLEKPQRKSVAPAKEVAAKEAAVREPAPKETGALREPAQPKDVKVAAKPKDAAPKEAAPAKAAKPEAARDVAKFDPTTIGTREPSGARLLWAFPPQKGAILAAGFAGNDQQIAVVIGPAGDTAVAGEVEMKRFDLATGIASDAYSLHSDTKTAIVGVSPSGNILASSVLGAAKGKKQNGKAQVSVHLWNIETVDNTEAIEMEVADRGDGIGLDHLAISRNGRRVIAAHRGAVEVFDATGLRGVSVYKLTARRDAAGPKSAMATSANGSRVVLTNGPRIRIMEGAGNVRDIGPGGNSPGFERIAITDNGALIAAASGAGIRFYDVSTGKESDALGDSPDSVAALAFSPGGDRLAVVSGNSVRIWTVQSRKPHVELRAAGAVDRVAFSNDGRMIVAASAQGTSVWYVDPASITEPAADTRPMVEAPAVPNSAIVTASVAKVEAPKAAEPARTPEILNAPTAKPEPVRPAQQAAASDPAKPEPAVENARRLATLGVERASALERMDCDRVKSLDVEIGSGALFGACASRADQVKRDADRQQRDQLFAERKVAIDALKCDEVKALDARVGDAGQHATCVFRVEQGRREAEVRQREKLLADRKAAIDEAKCDEVKALDAKIADGGNNHAACAFQAALKGNSARELYLAAAKYDADRDKASAKQLYRSIVDRFPQDDLAIRAAERMTLISDQEASGAKPVATPDASVDPVRRDRGTKRAAPR